jgi:endonuclease IV
MSLLRSSKTEPKNCVLKLEKHSNIGVCLNNGHIFALREHKRSHKAVTGIGPA